MAISLVCGGTLKTFIYWSGAAAVAACLLLASMSEFWSRSVQLSCDSDSMLGADERRHPP